MRKMYQFIWNWAWYGSHQMKCYVILLLTTCIEITTICVNSIVTWILFCLETTCDNIWTFKCLHSINRLSVKKNILFYYIWTLLNNFNRVSFLFSPLLCNIVPMLSAVCEGYAISMKFPRRNLKRLTHGKPKNLFPNARGSGWILYYSNAVKQCWVLENSTTVGIIPTLVNIQLRNSSASTVYQH